MYTGLPGDIHQANFEGRRPAECGSAGAGSGELLDIRKRILSYPRKDMLVPLYIKDPEVDQLTAELIALTKTSKVEAVKTALKHEIATRKGSLPLRDRLAKSLAMARAAGPFAAGDHKQETDAMWGGE